MDEVTILRALILEDNPDDAELMVRFLESWGYSVKSRVITTQAEFAHLLRSTTTFDVIIADYNLLGFSAFDAYEMLEAVGNRTPFLIITGVQEDQVCLAMLRRGAADYLRKDRLSRLGPAVERAVEHHRLFTQTYQGGLLHNEVQERLQDVLETLQAYRDRWSLHG